MIEDLFKMYESYLRDQRLQDRGSQIIDATLVPVPRQRNSREANKEIKENRMPEGWDENPNRLQQRDVVARWVQKSDVNHYGYKNNIHDSQMLPMFSDPENSDNYVWADSAYAGECFEDLLNLEGFKVAFTKMVAAITRLATQPKSVTVLNQLLKPVWNMFLAA